MAPQSPVTLETLQGLFHLPEKAVAKELNICLTSLKKICRQNGITRWPYRKLRSLERTMKKMNEDSSSLSNIATVMNNFPGATATTPAPTPKESESSTPTRTPPAASPVAACEHIEVKEEVQECASRRPEPCVMEVDRSNWPIFNLNDKMLTIINWSQLWTVSNLQKHLFTPLGGISMTFSPDGVSASMVYCSSAHASHAQKICQAASSMVFEVASKLEKPAAEEEEKAEATHTLDPVIETHIDACMDDFWAPLSGAASVVTSIAEPSSNSLSITGPSSNSLSVASSSPSSASLSSSVLSSLCMSAINPGTGFVAPLSRPVSRGCAPTSMPRGSLFGTPPGSFSVHGFMPESNSEWSTCLMGF